MFIEQLEHVYSYEQTLYTTKKMNVRTKSRERM